MVTLQMLLYFLTKRNLSPEYKEHSGQGKMRRDEPVFSGVHRFEGTTDEDAGRYLQIAVPDELLAHRDAVRSDVVCLVPCGKEVREKLSDELICSLIFVDSNYSVACLLNLLINLFSLLADWDKNMHIAALSGEPPQNLMRLSQGILEYPTIIFDQGFAVLAYSENVTEDYAYFHATVKRGYTDAETMNLVKEHDIFHIMEKEPEPFVAPAVEDENISNVYFAFRGDRNILGYACVFTNKKTIHPGYLDLLNIFSENMTFCLKRDFENRIFGQMMHEAFFHNLLNPTGISKEQVADQIRNLEGLSETGCFVLGVVRFYDHGEIPLPFIARQITQMMWDMKPFLYENQICLFRTMDQEKNQPAFLSEQEEKNLKSLLGHYTWSLGISNPFETILQLKTAYREANQALYFHDPEDDSICRYSDWYLFDLFSAIEQKMPVSRFCMGLYYDLKEYDRLHNDNYTELVLCYIKHDCNATHTAQAMYLHRNTVMKAVRFVEETWGVTLSDPDLKMQLLIGEQADRYVNAE